MPNESIKATDRNLTEWFEKINSGDIKLPRFQRHEAWDKKRIASLLSNVVNNLPLGITLILNIGDESKFIDRYIETAPETNNRATEHLLDGQQRLTAFWRMMRNNYDSDTYYVYIPEFDQNDFNNGTDEICGFVQTRWLRNETKFPVWADNPKECYKRGLIPANLLRPGDTEDEHINWMDQALEDKKPQKGERDFEINYDDYHKERENLKDEIVKLREIITHYNLPYLALSTTTEKDVALNVFINMNTNSKPLSLYDVIVAEVEDVEGESLHDLEENLDVAHPKVKHYFDLSELILLTSALLQDKLPNKKGMLDMDKSEMINNWGKLEKGLSEMVSFLESQKIYDRQRLPTNAVLAVMASLYAVIPDAGDERGQIEILLRKYLWSSFFTDRYENSAATHAFYDYINLKRVITNSKKDDGSLYTENDIPILDREKYSIATIEELITIGWPKQENIRGRAILAIASYLGANDFADGQEVSREHIQKREYHHIYPDALLEESGIRSYLALNCALITNATNRKIGRKDPLEYIKDRYKWIDQEVVNKRLDSHLIPVQELSVGGYGDMSVDDKKEKVKNDFHNFLQKRAEMVYAASKKLCLGENISYDEIIKEFE